MWAEICRWMICAGGDSLVECTWMVKGCWKTFAMWAEICQCKICAWGDGLGQCVWALLMAGVGKSMLCGLSTTLGAKFRKYVWDLTWSVKVWCLEYLVVCVGICLCKSCA